MKSHSIYTAVGLVVVSSIAIAAQPSASTVSDEVVKKQRAQLAKNTDGQGFGPQSPRNIDDAVGTNTRAFGNSPAYKSMNLCNIHFHKNAEHKGGEFTKYAGNGDGKGHRTGYKYSGKLSKSEATIVKTANDFGVNSGDTIEVHYVHTSAQVKPGPTLGSCISDAIKNPQLRVETQVYVLVNDADALDFNSLASYSNTNGVYQADNIPTNTGRPITYSGSTTGPKFNEQASPFQVTWSVRPKVAKINTKSVHKWLSGNDFNEDHAHGVRNLVTNPSLLSAIN